MMLWHPEAEVVPVPNRPGKEWSGTGGKKLILHTWEFTNRLPNYTTPPHLTLWTANFAPGGVRQLLQHVPFDKAAYSITDSDDENDENVWQVEVSGRAAMVPGYPDVWYRDVAWLIDWFVAEQGLPVGFADFSVMLYGKFAPQRMNTFQFKEFAGVLGHGHVGRGSDRHWDPGKLNVDRVMSFMSSEDVDMSIVIEALQAQDTGWYTVLQGKTGTPAGDPRYWGDGRASEAEWVAAAPALLGAVFQAGVQGPFDAGSVDVVSRGEATRANVRLDGIVVPD